MTRVYLQEEVNKDFIRLNAKGGWTLESVPSIEKELQNIGFDKKIIWDFTSVREFDSAGVLLFAEYFKHGLS